MTRWFEANAKRLWLTVALQALWLHSDLARQILPSPDLGLLSKSLPW